MTEPTSTRALERVVTFTDAVVAIALTLVALPLVDTARDAEDPASFFQDNHFALIAAAISFVVIGLFWRVHQQMFDRASDVTQAIIRANLAWIAGIVFLPIATVLNVGAPGDDRLSISLYVGTMLYIVVVQRLLGALLERAALVPSHEGSPLSPYVTVAMMTLALIIAVAVPSIGLWALLLLLAAGPIATLLNRGR